MPPQNLSAEANDAARSSGTAGGSIWQEVGRGQSLLEGHLRLTNISNKRTAKNAKTALYWLPPMRRTAAASKKPNMHHIAMNNQDPEENLDQFEVIFRTNPYVSAIHKLNSR